jgi:hypothetical protein
VKTKTIILFINSQSSSPKNRAHHTVHRTNKAATSAYIHTFSWIILRTFGHPTEQSPSSESYNYRNLLTQLVNKFRALYIQRHFINVCTVTIPRGRLIPFIISHWTSPQSTESTHRRQVAALTPRTRELLASQLGPKPAYQEALRGSVSPFRQISGYYKLIQSRLLVHSLQLVTNTIHSVSYRQHCHKINKQLR